MTGSRWLLGLKGRNDRRAAWWDVVLNGNLDDAMRQFERELVEDGFVQKEDDDEPRHR